MKTNNENQWCENDDNDKPMKWYWACGSIEWPIISSEA